ncbi:MAG: hypothetical protein AB7U75_01990 [Hyphomicrobiaceae bacterium]
MSPMSLATEIIAAAERAGLRLDVHNGAIRFRGPRAALQPDLLDKLRRYRLAVIAALSAPPTDNKIANIDHVQQGANIPDGTELSEWYATEINVSIDKLPEPTSLEGYRLLDLTRLFLNTPNFSRAVQFGWSREELFGIGPNSIFDHVSALGLIPALAFPLWMHKLESIQEDRAMMRARNGSMYVYHRVRSVCSGMQPWWESDQVVSQW